MKMHDLRALLKRSDVPDYLYDLNGGGDDEVVGIRKHVKWEVYSASRGKKTVLFDSQNEGEAIERFIYYLSKSAQAYGFTLVV